MPDVSSNWADQLLAFQEISALISSSLSLKQTLDTIVNVTTRLLGTQRASIALREPGSDRLLIDPQMGHAGTSEEFARSFHLKMSEGVGGLVMRTQKPYVVCDSAAEPLFTHDLAQKEGARAWICAPLVSKGQSTGLLYALNDHSTAFSDEQVKLAVVLASQAAIAVENARLFEETEQRLRESKALFQVVQSLTQSSSLDTLLQLIVDEATKAVPSADKAVIHLLSGELLVPLALSKSVNDQRPSAAMRAGTGIAGRALQLKQTQYVADTKTEPGFVDRGTGLRSLLVAPLIIDVNVIGTLSVDSKIPHAFNLSSQQLLTLLANQAAIAIEKARLFEETLSEKRRIEAIINNMADGVMMLDRDERIVSMNPTLARMLGQSSTRLVGTALTSAPYPLDAFKASEHLSFTGSEVSEAEVQVGEPLNKVFKVAVSPVADSTGQMLGHVVVVHDITREHELDQMKSDFISTVSHELRTPLFSIRGFVRLLLEGKVKDEATRTEFLNIVSQQSEHLTTIVNDLLDLSRLEAGHAIELTFEALDPIPVIQEVIARLSGLAGDKNLTLETDLPPSLPQVRADARRLNQVLVNLIGNAIKFTPDGGSVSLSATQLDGWLDISVADTGIGIPADAMPHLFERFYQVDHSATRKAGGTGLGLYITKQIVESLGGEVHVESALGKGSRFSVRLPIVSQQ